jgi:hypothetical protein
MDWLPLRFHMSCAISPGAGRQPRKYSGNEVIGYVSFPPRAEFIPAQAGAGAGSRESIRSRNAGYPLEFTLAQAGAGMTQNTNKLS